MSDSDEYDIEDFLDQKGAIGILSQIEYNDSNTFGELNNATTASHTNISSVLEHGVKIDLLERVPQKPDDHGHTKRYELTRRGKKLRAELNSRGTVDVYQTYHSAVQDLEDHEEELIEWVDDADITDPDWPYEPAPAAEDLRDRHPR